MQPSNFCFSDYRAVVDDADSVGGEQRYRLKMQCRFDSDISMSWLCIMLRLLAVRDGLLQSLSPSHWPSRLRVWQIPDQVWFESPNSDGRAFGNQGFAELAQLDGG